MKKSCQLNLSITPEAKDMLDQIAQMNLRTRSNMVETLVRKAYAQVFRKEAKEVEHG